MRFTLNNKNVLEEKIRSYITNYNHFCSNGKMNAGVITKVGIHLI